MKIRLLNKQLGINDAADTVELELVIRVPIALARVGDYKILSADFYEQVGRELFELLDK